MILKDKHKRIAVASLIINPLIFSIGSPRGFLKKHTTFFSEPTHLKKKKRKFFLVSISLSPKALLLLTLLAHKPLMLLAVNPTLLHCRLPLVASSWVRHFDGAPTDDRGCHPDRSLCKNILGFFFFGELKCFTV